MIELSYGIPDMEQKMNDMVEVEIDSIRVSLMSQQRIVILREQDAERYLPIWIGIYEAESITIALQQVEVARPLTHDLIKSLFKELGTRIIRVEVISLRDDTFFGNIVLEADGRVFNIDSRPSDAIAIAVRTHVPILVAREVMDAAGIIPDDDLQDDQTEPSSEVVVPEDEVAEERLSIFEDFFDQLNSSDQDDTEDSEEE